MKLAVSNIGWPPERTNEVLPQLRGLGVEGLVIAPTMAFPDQGAYVPSSACREFYGRLKDAGLALAGLQSLTFGLKGASLFGDIQERQTLIEHLKWQADLASSLRNPGSTPSLIFGSPGLRKNVEAGGYEKALEVFREVGACAMDNGAKLCIEPLSGYGNQFVTTTQEGVDFVRRANHPGVGLHLDAAAIDGAGEHPDRSIRAAHKAVRIQSFDASAPELGPIAGDDQTHEAMSAALTVAGYTGFVSLEMLAPKIADANMDPVDTFLEDVQALRRYYGQEAA